MVIALLSELMIGEDGAVPTAGDVMIGVPSAVDEGEATGTTEGEEHGDDCARASTKDLVVIVIESEVTGVRPMRFTEDEVGSSRWSGGGTGLELEDSGHSSASLQMCSAIVPNDEA